MEKLIELNEVRKLFKSGDRILVGGFGLSGTPLTIIDEMLETDIKDLTIVSNNLGDYGKGLHKVFLQGKIKKAIGSFFTSNREAVAAWAKGDLEIELVPQGTLAEAIRCGGAGIGGFYTKTGVGTELAIGKEEKELDGERYILEKAIKGDISIIKAFKADRSGNLIYHTTARNFNPVMATAGNLVIAEVDEIVDDGELNPEDIVTPHAYVDYVVLSKYVKKGKDYIEKQ